MAGNSTLLSSLTPFQNDAKALQFIEEITQNADAVQKDVLTQILTRNAETEYLKSFNLNGATDPETFKSKIPVVTYEDIQPLVQRIANGDFSPILSAQPITEFLTSTGTSGGEKKLIPLTKEEIDRRNLLQSLFMPVINQYVKGLDQGKGLCFYSVHHETKTPGGLLARFSLTSYFKSDYFKTQIHYLSKIYTSPIEAVLCEDSFQSMYTQMLCGLYKREQVFWVGSLFASCFLQAIKFLQCNWQQLTQDIRTGSLNPKVADPSIRNCMTRMLKPDPILAGFITRECEKEDWEGIVTRIWPNTKYLDVIVTGTMAQYIPILKHYSGGLPIASIVYSSSECYFGLNLNPICDPYKVNYTLMPNMAYFEFLPHERADSVDSAKASSEEVVDLADVVIGKEYEVLVTTYAGLYRYRVGDILRVDRFYNSAPQFQFVGRKNVLLSVHVDKTYECEIQEAIVKASQLLNNFSTSVAEYTSCVDTTTIPGHYVIYWELLGKEPFDWPSSTVLDQCCLAMEKSLNSMYRQCRVEEKSIGPLEIRIVKNGTFEELMDYAISRGASIDQYKVPRCISATPILKLLNSRVVSIHFSPSLPQWASGPCG